MAKKDAEILYTKMTENMFEIQAAWLNMFRETKKRNPNDLDWMSGLIEAGFRVTFSEIAKIQETLDNWGVIDGPTES